MLVTNLTSNLYDLPGLRLHALEAAAVVDDVRYFADERFRLELNTLFGNGKISVTGAPNGFPVATAAEIEIANGEVPGAGENGGSSASVTDGITTVAAASSLHLPAGTVTDLGGGEAAVGLIVQALGPVTVAFNDFDLQGSGDTGTLLTLPAGSSVIDCWAKVTTPWQSAGDTIPPDQEEIVVQVGDVVVGAFDPRVQITGANYWREAGAKTTTPTRVWKVGVTADQPLKASYSFNGDEPIQGAADIYVLIVTPAT